MSQTPFINSKIRFMPPGYSSTEADPWIGSGFPVSGHSRLGRIKHQAFAAGFFGFHYIRATVENTPSLREDSLYRFMKLLKELHLDESFTSNLNITEIHTYSEFNKQIIRRVSLEMGDHFCTTIQWMVEFGFYLAITYSSLVTAVKCRSSAKLKYYLDFIESEVSLLITLAKKSEVPNTIIHSLQKSKQLVKHKKNRPAIRKCFNNIGLAAESLLVTNVAIGFLD